LPNRPFSNLNQVFFVNKNKRLFYGNIEIKDRNQTIKDGLILFGVGVVESDGINLVDTNITVRNKVNVNFRAFFKGFWEINLELFSECILECNFLDAH